MHSCISYHANKFKCSSVCFESGNLVQLIHINKQYQWAIFQENVNHILNIGNQPHCRLITESRQDSLFRNTQLLGQGLKFLESSFIQKNIKSSKLGAQNIQCSNCIALHHSSNFIFAVN